MQLLSKDGVPVNIEIYELHGRDIGRQLTGGIRDIKISSADGFLVKLSGSWGAPKDRIPVDEILTEAFGAKPISWSSFEFEVRKSHVDISKAVEHIRKRIENLNLTRVWTGSSAQVPPAPRRQREKMAASSFTQGEFATLLDEIEEDYGDVVEWIAGKAFLRGDTSLASHWSARYDGPDVRKEITVDFTITGTRTRRRIEEQVEVQPGFLGRLFGKKPAPRTVVRYEKTDEIKSIDVLLVSNFTVSKLLKKEVGRDFVTGGTVDYAARVGGTERSENKNVIVNEVITPRTLDLLDPTVRKALLAFKERANVTFGAS
jgi:hypothetical protein